ncbi:MAG: DUF3606 domain-containing protein [Vitreoscilla sp.]
MFSNQSPLREPAPRIDVKDYFDLRSWAKRYGVTPGDVRRAVACVGDRAEDVEAHLAVFAHSTSEASVGE